MHPFRDDSCNAHTSSGQNRIAVYRHFVQHFCSIVYYIDDEPSMFFFIPLYLFNAYAAFIESRYSGRSPAVQVVVVMSTSGINSV